MAMDMNSVWVRDIKSAWCNKFRTTVLHVLLFVSKRKKTVKGWWTTSQVSQLEAPIRNHDSV